MKMRYLGTFLPNAVPVLTAVRVQHGSAACSSLGPEDLDLNESAIIGNRFDTAILAQRSDIRQEPEVPRLDAWLRHDSLAVFREMLVMPTRSVQSSIG